MNRDSAQRNESVNELKLTLAGASRM